MVKVDRRVWARRGLWVVLALGLGALAWHHGHDYLFPEKLVEVVPGKVYRGAWQHDWPMRQIVRDHKIKTIIALAHPPGDPMAVREEALAKEMGVRWLHLPIVEEVIDGHETTVADAIDRAAAAVADPANQPVYFHCHHGVNRAALVQMAFRMRYCGWSLDQALDEIRRTTGLIEVKHGRGVDYRSMGDFYRDRILSRRTTAASEAVRR
ncbi:MAG TPA: dual specificity protein phosphatase family protein [Isosphaeraceae bacterium]|jgi:protein tyrosine phosphatase (PTP) superfamily phosphohydrolase (DUF442 family)|nr:dual specificity protein phosphatase family protein [Isosphaeraceae bacterium]